MISTSNRSYSASLRHLYPTTKQPSEKLLINFRI
ncbi:hypothetical protein EMIT043CA1_260011 [Pseudomonas brassicacearum]